MPERGIEALWPVNTLNSLCPDTNRPVHHIYLFFFFSLFLCLCLKCILHITLLSIAEDISVQYVCLLHAYIYITMDS